MMFEEKYICTECREVVSELPCEEHKIREDFGIHRATVAVVYTETTRCECGGRLEPALHCRCCGEIFAESELNREEICAECESRIEEAEDRLSPRFAPRRYAAIKIRWIPTENLMQKEDIINVALV